MAQAAEGQLSAGGKCDRYEIVRLLGSGGMGEVYEAVHEFTRKPVALKVLKIHHAAKEALIEKMRVEAMVLCRVRHPHLVEVFDAGIAEGRIWMAMELLDGRSLREHLRERHTVPLAQALDWGAQIADGLQAAHDLNIIHRDLKPENVFITARGELRVLDFGTAKFQGMQMKRTERQDRHGTIAYMSPEHLGGEEVDVRSDVYALGLVLYEMLSGRHPFADERGAWPPLEQMFAMQLGAEPPPLTEIVGASAWRLVERALAKERSGRYPAAKAFAAAIREVRARLTADHAVPSGLGISVSDQTTAPIGNLGATGRPSQLTPPPITASGAHPVARPRRGIGGLALSLLALGAATASATAVFVVGRAAGIGSRAASEPPASPTTTTASPTTTAAAPLATGIATTTPPTASATPPPTAGGTPPAREATAPSATSAAAPSPTATAVARPSAAVPPPPRPSPSGPKGGASPPAAPPTAAPVAQPPPAPKPPPKSGEIF
jgi:serine/threonine-protein kinase